MAFALASAYVEFSTRGRSTVTNAVAGIKASVLSLRQSIPGVTAGLAAMGVPTLGLGAMVSGLIMAGPLIAAAVVSFVALAAAVAGTVAFLKASVTEYMKFNQENAKVQAYNKSVEELGKSWSQLKQSVGEIIVDLSFDWITDKIDGMKKILDTLRLVTDNWRIMATIMAVSMKQAMMRATASVDEFAKDSIAIIAQVPNNMRRALDVIRKNPFNPNMIGLAIEGRFNAPLVNEKSALRGQADAMDIAIRLLEGLIKLQDRPTELPEKAKKAKGTKEPRERESFQFARNAFDQLGNSIQQQLKGRDAKKEEQELVRLAKEGDKKQVIANNHLAEISKRVGIAKFA